MTNLRFNMEELVLKQLIDYVELLINCQEPIKASEILNLAPACIAYRGEVQALRERLHERIDHVYTPERYAERYKPLNDEAEPTFSGGTPTTQRGRRAQAMIADMCKKGTVRAMAVGVWDCALEKVLLENNPNFHVDILEASDGGNRAARKLTEMFPGRVNVVTRSTPLGFEDEATRLPEKYDVVMCFEVLEHTSDYKLAAEQLLSHVKDTGVLMLSVPNAVDWVEPFPARQFKHDDENMFFGHLWMFSGLHLCKLFPEAELILDDSQDGTLFVLTQPKETTRQVKTVEARTQDDLVKFVLEDLKTRNHVITDVQMRANDGSTIVMYHGNVIIPTRFAKVDK